MIIGIIGILMVGVTAGCILFIVSRLFKGILPAWIIPIGAAASMVIFYIYSEYAWFYRTSGSLPENVVVAQTYDTRQILQPWTYIVPKIEHFSAIDLNDIKSNNRSPGYKLFEVLLVTRYAKTGSSRQMINCNEQQRAFINDSTKFSDDGLPIRIKWDKIERDDPIFKKVCQG